MTVTYRDLLHLAGTACVGAGAIGLWGLWAGLLGVGAVLVVSTLVNA